MFEFTSLSALDLFIEFPAIRVQLVSKWQLEGVSNTKKVEMVLGDDKGSTIRATYEDVDLPSENLMKEGHWFEIYNFKLNNASGLVRLTKNRYHVLITNETVISKFEGSTYCKFYSFSNFRDIIRGLGHPKFSIDLYGRVVGVRDIEVIEEKSCDNTIVSKKPKLQFSLINIGYYEIKCVAYGHIAQQLHDFCASTHANVVLCVLKFWRIIWGEGCLQHITNIEGSSKLLFEPDIPEINAFRLKITNEAN